MKLFDTHTHVNFQPFKGEYTQVIQRALDAGIIINNVGSQWESSQESVRIAEEFAAAGISGVYASIGLHPMHVLSDIVEEHGVGESMQKIVSRAEDFITDDYRKLAKSSKYVVGIGECGLDYYHFERSQLEDRREELTKAQHDIFRRQLELAVELDLALIIHCRDAAVHNEDTSAAFEDLLTILRSYSTLPRFVVHCYTGLAKYVPEFLELGAYLGYTGIITFSNATEVQAAVKATPIERIVLETDAPYLAPMPNRGKRNEPYNVQFVAAKIAELKGVSLDVAAEQTTNNALTLFNIQA